MKQSYSAFLDQILVKIREKLPSGTEAGYQKITKNNGVEYTALCFLCKERSFVSPLVYMEPFYKAHLSGMSEERIAATAAQVLLNYMPAEIRFSEFIDPDYLREHIVFRLVGRERNRELLKKTVYREFLDLAVTYGIYISDAELGNGITMVTDSLLKMWKVTEQELFAYAYENTSVLLGERLESMRDMLRNETDSQDAEMYVLSNRSSFYGASAILYSNALKELSARLQKDIYIMPSSVHELVLVPKETEQAAFLRKLVSEVNETEVRQEYVLSDQVYLYSREANRISLCD